MKILLIQPQGNYIRKTNGEVGAKLAVPPLGLLYIASYLQQNGYDNVEILDCQVEDFTHEEPVRTFRGHKIIRYGLSDNNIFSEINNRMPDIVGISCLQCTRSPEAHSLAQIVKKVNKDIKTVIGGQYASSLSGLVIKDTNIDYCIKGEGERAMLTIADEVKEELAQNHTHTEHYGITINGEPLNNIDHLYPAWDLIDLKKYAKINLSPNRKTKNKNYTIMITSRGCAHSCIYCPVRNIFGSKWRGRSSLSIMNEIEMLRNLGIQEIQFEDSDILASKKRMLTLCEQLKKSDISWCSPHGMSIQKLDKELLSTMYESGCYALHLSVEFGSERMLTKIKPTVDLKYTKNIVAYAKGLGMDITTFTMIGHPNETKEDVNKTIDFTLSLEPNAPYFFLMQPMPNTPFHDWCSKNKFILDDFQWDNLRYSIQNLKNKNFEFNSETGYSELEQLRYDVWQGYMSNQKSTYDFWRKNKC